MHTFTFGKTGRMYRWAANIHICDAATYYQCLSLMLVSEIHSAKNENVFTMVVYDHPYMVGGVGI